MLGKNRVIFPGEKVHVGPAVSPAVFLTLIPSAGLLSLDLEGRLGVWGCPRNGPDRLMLKMHVHALSSPPGALVVVWGAFVELHGLASS